MADLPGALDLAASRPPTTEEGSAVGTSYGVLADDDVDRATPWKLPNRWKTMETMVTDPLVSASLSALTYPVLASELMVEPASDNPEGRQLADFVSQGLNNMTTGLLRHRAEVLACVGEGVRVFEVVYEKREDGHWHPRKLALRPNKTIADWHVDDHGGPDGITQAKPAGGTARLPMDKLLVFTHMADGPSLLGRPAMRAMYRPWTILDKLARVAAIGFYRNSVGIPWAKYEGGSATEAGKLDRALQAVGAAEKSFLRTDKDVTNWGIMGTDGTLKDPVPFMEFQRRDLFLASLAQFLALGTDGTGSYALSQDQSGIYMLAVRFIAEEIEDVYNRHLIPAWLGYNFANLPKDRLPRVKHGVIDQRNTVEFATAVKALVEAGVELPMVEVAKASARLLGFSLPDETAPEDEAPDVADVNDPNAPEATDGDAVEAADRGSWTGVDLAAKRLESEIKLEALGLAVNFEGMSRALDEGRDRIIEKVGALQAKQARRLVAIGKRAASGKPVRVGGQLYEGEALIAALLTGEVEFADRPRLVYYDEEAEVIEDELWALYGSGWEEAGAEIEQQGGDAAEPEADSSRGRIAGAALVMAVLLADRMQVSWATEMTRQLRAGFNASTLGGMLTGGRLLTDQASRAANVALAEGRADAMARVESVMLSAVMDARTCAECAQRDGRVYPKDKAPTVPLDVCHGGNLCRCQHIPLLASA